MALPIETLISGTTDANGNATITQLSSSSKYTVLKLVALTTGNAQWTVKVAGGIDGFGQGARVEVGPFPCSPGENVVIIVTSAQANVAVTGQLVGIQADTIEEAAGHFNPSPSTISVLSSAPQTVLGTLDPSAGNVNQTFIIPFGTQSVGISYSFAGGHNNLVTEILLTGVPSQATYIDLPKNSLGSGATQWSGLNPVDTSVKCTVTSPGGGGVMFVQVVASPLPMVGQTTPDTRGNAGVSLQNAQPALWQAPTSFAGIVVGTGGGAVVVTGIPGQTIRVFSWKLEAGTLGATRFLGLRTSGGTQFDSTFASGWMSSMTDRNGYAGGVPMTIGDALVLDSTAANGEFVRASVGYSQG